jgi:O-antigen ligase
LGSDWFRSYTWWLDPKVSHNLYLSVLVETGFIGLVGLIVFLAVIYLRLPPGRGKSLFYITVVSGLISHGFVSDSQFRIMLFAAMALAIVSHREETRGASP